MKYWRRFIMYLRRLGALDREVVVDSWRFMYGGDLLINIEINEKYYQVRGVRNTWYYSPSGSRCDTALETTLWSVWEKADWEKRQDEANVRPIRRTPEKLVYKVRSTTW
jgi:hypothetical protein